MTLSERIAPGTLAGDSGYRALMLSAATRIRRGDAPSSLAVSRALVTTALGRIPEPERDWIGRIERYRPELPARAITATQDAVDRPHAERLEEAKAAVRWMSMPPLLGRLVLRTVRELGPASVLELGTGFGVSTSYGAAALELSSNGRLTSLDVPDMSAMAAVGLADLGLGERVDLVPGRIEETLGPVLDASAPVEFALLDADHTEAGTVEVFSEVVRHAAPGAVIVLDDINWTDPMRRAWERVRRHERTAASVALRRLGIVVVEGRVA